MRHARRSASGRNISCSAGSFVGCRRPVAAWVDQFAYPFRWTYNVLNAAEYFRQAALLDRVRPDPRMTEAIEMIRAARQPDGTWLQAGRQPGRVSKSTCKPANDRSG